MRAAALMAIALIATRARLDPAALSAIIDSIIASRPVHSSNQNQNSFYKSLLCIVTVLQHQPLISSLPSNAAISLIKSSGFSIALSDIASKYNTDAFVEPLLNSIISIISSSESPESPESPEKESPESSFEKEASDLFVFILNYINIALPAFSRILNNTISSYVTIAARDPSSSIAASLANIILRVHNKHLAITDKIIASLFKSVANPDSPADIARRDALRSLSSSFLKGTILQAVDANGTSLFLSLNHPDPHMRIAGIDNLKSITLDMVDSSDPNLSSSSSLPFVCESLLARIADDDHDVAAAALGFPNITSIVPIAPLAKAAMLSIVAPGTSQRLYSAALAVIGQILALDNVPPICYEIFLGLLWRAIEGAPSEFTHLLPHASRSLVHLGFAKTAADSLVAWLNQRIAAPVHDAQTPNPVDKDLPLQILAQGMHQAPEFRAFVIQHGIISRFTAARILALDLIATSLSGSSSSQGDSTSLLPQDIMNVLPTILNRLGRIPFKTSIIQDSGMHLMLSENAAFAPPKHVEHVAILKTALVILAKLPQTPPAWLHLDTPAAVSQADISIRVFEAFLSVKNSVLRENLLQAFLLHACQKGTIEFCALMYSQDYSRNLRHLVIDITTKFIVTAKSKPLDYQLLVPSLMLALSDPSKFVRVSALSGLEAIRSTYALMKLSSTKLKPEKVYGYGTFYGAGSTHLAYLTSAAAAAFVVKILDWAEEIIADPTFFANAIHLALADTKRTQSRESDQVYQEDLLVFLLTNIMAHHNVEIQVRLLRMISRVHSPVVLKTLLPLVEKNLSLVLTDRPGAEAQESDDVVSSRFKLLAMLSGLFIPSAVASSFKSRSGRSLRAFCRLLAPGYLRGENVNATSENSRSERLDTIRAAALDQVNATWFAAVPQDKQGLVLSALINLAAHSSGAFAPRIKTILKALPISGETILPLIETARLRLLHEDDNDADPSTQDVSSKRTKLTIDQDRNEIIRTVILLELLQFKDGMEHADRLIGALFELLAAAINSELVQSLAEVEYFKQLVMTALERIFRYLITDRTLTVNEESVRIDVVVQCLRLTDNPQTHNAALLLLSTVATVAPQTVLVNIMPVFTFMGANVLRHDDSYTFHVIQQTLETVVPALLTRIPGTGYHDLKPLIDVFVQAMPHVPSHRRLHLFTLLVRVLGNDTYLGFVIALILTHVVVGGVVMTRKPGSVTDSRVFCLALLRQFRPMQQLQALLTVVTLAQSISCTVGDVTGEPTVSTSISPLLDVTATVKVSCKVKIQLIQFVCFVLKTRSDHSNGDDHDVTAMMMESGDTTTVSVLPDHDTPELEPVYHNLIQHLLTETDTITSSPVVTDTTLSTKFTRVYTTVLQDALVAVNTRVSLPAFMHACEMLLDRDQGVIRIRALCMLRQRVKVLVDEGVVVDVRVVMPVFDRLVTILGQRDVVDGGDVVKTRQVAMDCVSILSRVIDTREPRALTKAFELVMTSENCLMSTVTVLVSSSIVCLSEMVGVLGARVVPFLPRFVPVLMRVGRSVFESTKTTTTTITGDVILETEIVRVDSDVRVVTTASVYGAFIVLCDKLPQFMSSYLSDLVGFMTHVGMQTMPVRVTQLRQAVWVTLTQRLSMRALLPPIMKQLPGVLDVMGNTASSALTLVEMMSMAVTCAQGSSMIESSKMVTAFFLTGFAYRCRVAGAAVQPINDAYETALISAFVNVTLKVNEGVFRPMFHRIVEWATMSTQSLTQEGWTRESILSRRVMLYRLTESLFTALKSIFVPYFAMVFDDVLHTLDTGITHANLTESVDGCLLWTRVVTNLKLCMQYHGKDDFVTGDRVDTVIDTLMKQMVDTTVSVSVYGSAYVDRMSMVLVPAIGQLAMTFRSDNCWKRLTKHVLHNMRSDTSPALRLTAVKTLHEMYTRLGEEMLVYFPETVPVLAEVMEDDDVGVEQACQELCVLIQHYLGEPIQQYFTA